MEIIILSILILLNGFFALSEIALVSSKRNRLEQARSNGSYGATVALKLNENSERFLSAIQVGITLIGIVTGVYGGMSIADQVAPYLKEISIFAKYANEIALTLTVIIITYVSIVIGELVPKTIALSNPEKIAIKVAPIISYFSTAFYPFVILLSFSTSLINKLLGIKKPNDSLTESELKQLIKNASSEGVIEKEQNIIHEKVFYFSDKKAKHLMTHRTDVEWLNLEKPKELIYQELFDTHHSKVVCCKGDFDHFVGVLYLMDYYKSLAKSEHPEIDSLLVQPIIVPENAEAQKVLSLLREKHSHICFVVNEYGGFEGIITMHDIIENIIGHVPEEDELFEPDVFVREDNSVLVSGDAPVETLTEIIENFTINFEEIEYSTVAGFVFHEMNKIPNLGDQIEYMGYIIEIIDIDHNKIDKILIKKIPEENESDS